MKFELNFSKQFGFIDDEEVSRVLSYLFDNDATVVDAVTEVNSTRYANDETNDIVTNMLRVLAVVKNARYVEYCADCNVYSVGSSNSNVDICSSEHHKLSIDVRQKMFLCIWGEGYYKPNRYESTREETVDYSKFTVDNGYNEDDIRTILNLCVGEGYTMHDGGIHTVVRVR